MFNVFGGSIIGPYHLSKNLPNQDKWGVLKENGKIFLAVADGAGSLENSEMGAKLAITTAITYLRLNQDDKNVSIEEIVSDTIMKASENLKKQVDADQLGCTLTIVFINEDNYCVGVMGDALGIVKEYNKDFELIRPEQESEYANITKLLTSKNFPIELKTGNVNNLEFVAIGSDGMDLSSLEKGVPVAGFWNKLVQWGKEERFNMTEFLEFLYKKEKVNDDTTLVMAVNSNPEPIENDSYEEVEIIEKSNVVGSPVDNEIIGSMLSDNYDFSKIDSEKLIKNEELLLEIKNRF